MDSIILLYYKNKELGDYFILCKKDIEPLLKEKYPGADLIEITSRNCTSLFVETKLSKLKTGDYLFIAYCHGSKDSFNDPYSNPFLKKDDNDYLLKNASVFSNSCYSGIELGPALVENGAKLFIGFKGISWVLTDYYEVSILCDNFPIKLFLEKEFQPKEKAEIVKRIKDFYNEQIDELNKRDFFAATKVMNNRDNFTLLFPGDHQSIK